MRIKKLKHSFALVFPEYDNQRKSLTSLNLEITRKFINQFAGVTKTKAKGFWVYEKTLFLDEMNCYTATSEKPIDKIWVFEILKFCFEKTDQKAIFYILNGVSYIATK